MPTSNIVTTDALVESSQLDVIKFNGPSNSGLLTRLHKANVADIAAVINRLEDIVDNNSLLASLVATQSDSLSLLITSLTAQLPVMDNNWLIDFYTSTFLSGSNTAAVSNLYGQATLPITSVVDTLVARDIDNNYWIPDNTRIDYAYTTGLPTESDWRPDSNSKNALVNPANGIFWITEKGASDSCWVRVRPSGQISSNHLTNTIILHPYPALGLGIKSVSYRTPSSGWVFADLSYNWNWNSNSSKLTNSGPLRIFIPPTQIIELQIHLDLSEASVTSWGFSKICLQFLEFSSTATLAVDFTAFNPPSVDIITVLGKDRDVLNYLAPSILGDSVSIDLTQFSQGTTPVITGVQGESA